MKRELNDAGVDMISSQCVPCAKQCKIAYGASRCVFEGCGSACRTANDFASHELSQTGEKIHAGDKPYKCDFEGCGYACKWLGNLARHKLKYTK